MKNNRLVVIPSDALDDYIKNGMSEDFIANYYNPNGFYKEVFVVSPLERGIRKRCGMTVIGSTPMQLNRVIRKIKPDIIRGYDGFKCADWLSTLRIKKVPIVCSVHDRRPELIHQSLKYADLVICMSNIVKEEVCKQVKGIDINKIVVMPNRIDLTLFQKKYDKEFTEKQRGNYQRKFHIIHVGRKSEEKNIDTVIKTMKYLGDDYEVIFIGRGDSEVYKRLAYEENVADKCHFIESVPNSELPYWYSWCDCMCTPSRCEGFGIVFLEAAACETKIVTSDIAPMNEYLTNNKSALLVKEYENPEVLAEAIKKACTMPKDGNMGVEAREVAKTFSKYEIDKKENEWMSSAISYDKVNFNKEFWGIRMALYYESKMMYNQIKRKLVRLKNGNFEKKIDTCDSSAYEKIN